MNFRAIRYLSRLIAICGFVIVSLWLFADVILGASASILPAMDVTVFMAFYIGMIFLGVIFEVVMDRREFRRAAAVLKGKPEFKGVVSEEFELNKGKNYLIVKYKTNMKIGFTVEKPMFAWDITVKKGDPMERTIEAKRIDDWLRAMKANGFGVDSIEQEGHDVRIYLGLGGFDGPGFVRFAREARVFLRLEAPVVLGPEVAGAVRTRELNPAEKEMELKTYGKDWGAIKFLLVGLAIPTFVGIGMIVLWPAQSVLGWAMSLVCALFLAIFSFAWYSHLKIMKEIEAGVLNVKSERITWVLITPKKMDEDGKDSKNWVIIGGEEVNFPEGAPFNYKVGDNATVERYPSGRIYKVDGIRVRTY